ncbi:MAG: oligosaccharide flippase family protein [Clostridiales bacterium]|nr:oligosaccharide flippase family protein [Clostridiales bacterium]
MTGRFHLSANRRAFLGGTLLLTGSGFACRVLGFFYRIFLSRTIGAEGLGLYHMIHPVYGICFALCAGSIQTALSQHIASHLDRAKKSFRTGLLISLSLSVLLAWLICQNAAFLAETILLEPRCTPYLPFMGISIPFAAVHSCINGWYYGVRRANIPAWSQIVEQTVRMALVFLLASLWIREGRQITVLLAVIGHVIGEAAAAAFTVLCLLLRPPLLRKQSSAASSGRDDRRQKRQPADRTQPEASPSAARRHVASDAASLMTLALPLMGSRLILNILAGAEAVWIPNSLQQSGLSSSEAFAVYGVLTGMALPFVFFPSAIANSMAVLLLPGVAQAQAEGRQGSIRASITLSLRYSMYMGILCIGIFVLFGAPLGQSVFHSESAGQFIQILAWLCPFLYLAATLGSVLNGLGYTRTTFALNTGSMLVRIGFILIGVPRYGITACLCGMLASELILALACLLCLRAFVPFSWNAWEMIVLPALFLATAIGVHFFLIGVLPLPGWIPLFFQTMLQIGIVCTVYGGLLLAFHFSRAKQ